MKRFLSAVALCVFLLLFGLFVFLPPANAEKNLLENLLNLPAPPPPNPLMPRSARNRPADFYDKSKVPSDGAPIEDLLAYWQQQSGSYSELGYNIKPSDETLRRIQGEVENNPEKLSSFLNSLPDDADTASFVKRIYEQNLSGETVNDDWRDAVKKWLTYHSNAFSDDLLRVAQQVGDTGEYVSNQEELLALARVDWDKAAPILERLYSDGEQPVAQVLARWAYYRHALDTNSSSDTDKYRDELKAVVENKSAKPGMRDLALDALVKEKEWDAREDWYLSLLEDETLADLRVNGQSYTGLTTIMYYAPPEKYLAKMLELAKSDNLAIRSAAVRNLTMLLNSKNPEVVRALLPWLENANWVKESNGERRRVINALAELQMPESVPGLIAVLNEKTVQDAAPSMNVNKAMNANMMNRQGDGTTVEYYPYRAEAINALAMQKDIRAAAPLRLILPQVEEWQRGNVVRAILNSRGFSVPEQVEALELAAQNYKPNAETMTGNTVARVNSGSGGQMIADSEMVMPQITTMMSNKTMPDEANRPFNPADIKPLLGAQLVSQTDAEEDLVTALIERISVLDTKDPPLAFGLRKIMQSWNGAAVNRLLLRDLKNNKADTDAVVKLLSLRKDLRENQSNDVFDVRGGSPTALGIAACILEDANEFDTLLAGENTEAKAAMLICSRLIRANLPVRKVAENLRNPNKTLALAAERYLESEDSTEARQIVLSLHPNEARILGARTYFAADDSPVASSDYLPALFSSVNDSLPDANYYLYSGNGEQLGSAEKKLQKEVKENQELLGVYAFDDNFVRIYKDKAVFSWQTDKARYRERDLRTEEFDNLKSYLAAERAGELVPFLGDCESECEGKELLMLGRQGGRRVFSLNDPQPKFFAGLETMFAEMRLPPAKLHYWLEKNIGGLDILFEDENQQAVAVWKVGDDFRVLINNQARRKQIDKEIEQQEKFDAEKLNETNGGDDGYEKYQKLEDANRKRREQREYENYAWYKFAGNTLAGITAQPGGSEYLPAQDGAAIRGSNQQWKARTAAFEIRGDGDALYKVAGGRMTKIRSGYYDKPIVASDGRWMVATKYAEEIGRQLIRINLLNNKESVINFEEHPLVEAVAFIPSLNKVLLFGGEYNEYEGEEEEPVTEKNGEYYLLDVETGMIQKAKGEIRPLAQQTFRPLQPTGNPDEVWAAIPDPEKEVTQVGTYNLKTLAFKPLIKVPQITFDSMQMWVDAGKIYFVYEGHLLSLPLAKAAVNPIPNP